jgi:hypothetical protein
MNRALFNTKSAVLITRPELESLQEEVKGELAERAALELELKSLEAETSQLRLLLEKQIAKTKPKNNEENEENNATSSPNHSSNSPNPSSPKPQPVISTKTLPLEVTLLSTSSFLGAANAVLRHNLFQVLADQRSVVLDISELNREQKAEVEWVLSDSGGNYGQKEGNTGGNSAASELQAYSLSRRLESNPFDAVNMSVDQLTHYFKQISPNSVGNQGTLLEDLSDSIQNNRSLHAECETKYKYANNAQVAENYGFSSATNSYEFDEEDSSNNIIVEADPGAVPAGGSAQKSIKCATLNKLIEKVTHEKHVDLNTRFVFLLTYHSFCSPQQLLAKLTARYNVPLPPNITPPEATLFRSTKLDRIQIRVCSVLKNWLEEHFSDFEGENGEKLKKELRKLIKNMAENSASVLTRGLATGLANILAKREKSGPTKKIISTNNCPKPLISSKVTLESFNFMECNEIELARQLTLIDFEKFRLIQPRECLNQNWSKKNKDILAPNIIAMIEQFNKVSAFVQYFILQQKELNKRAAAFQKFLKIAEACRNLNNFNSLFAIYCGLTANPIHRLKKTRELIGNKAEKKFSEYKELFRGDKNSRNFRRVLQTTLTPCIPHLGIFLSDLTFTEDGNPDELLGMINFQKRCKLAERIRWIKQYQQEGYQLESWPIIQSYFVKFLQVIDPEVLWKSSKEVEPSDAS